MPARLGEVLLVDLRDPLVAGEFRPLLEQLDRLLLDRVRVRQVLRQLGVDVVGRAPRIPAGG